MQIRTVCMVLNQNGAYEMIVKHWSRGQSLYAQIREWNRSHAPIAIVQYTVVENSAAYSNEVIDV